MGVQVFASGMFYLAQASDGDGDGREVETTTACKHTWRGCVNYSSKFHAKVVLPEMSAPEEETEAKKKPFVHTQFYGRC